MIRWNLYQIFEVDDVWFSQDKATRSMLPKSFSVREYRRLNPDLSQFSDSKLKNHFATHGYKEGRLFSNASLKIKNWVRDELMQHGKEGLACIAILDEFLDLVIQKTSNQRQGSGVLS